MNLKSYVSTLVSHDSVDFSHSCIEVAVCGDKGAVDGCQDTGNSKRTAYPESPAVQCAGLLAAAEKGAGTLDVGGHPAIMHHGLSSPSPVLLLLRCDGWPYSMYTGRRLDAPDTYRHRDRGGRGPCPGPSMPGVSAPPWHACGAGAHEAGVVSGLESPHTRSQCFPSLAWSLACRAGCAPRFGRLGVAP